MCAFPKWQEESLRLRGSKIHSLGLAVIISQNPALSCVSLYNG